MRAVAVLASCLAVLAAAGCGGGGGSAAPAATGTPAGPQAALVDAGLEPPGGCYVTVFLVEDATPDQVAQVRRRLLVTRGITEVAFVSKELELRRFAVANPAAAKGVHANPFADRFEVVPATRASVVSIVGDFAVKGGPITNVKPSTGCSGPA